MHRDVPAPVKDDRRGISGGETEKKNVDEDKK